ncbi:MAG TPA: Ig-like domain-containing protein, partial [Spirochaetia bacterium]|nr:Ig-like domain-containing protein [Spirochaetia bacterium]
MKRNLSPALLLLLVLVSSPLLAKGTQEKDYQEAQGKDNFSQSVDLTKLTPGQYNILVRTKDAAGNVSYAGPYNFYYDPNSDNPIITVANPAPGIRVGGSLNVVGVCSAPKGVAKVEVQVDGADWVLAQGKAFWSFFLNTSAMSDGPHQIAVRGTDVNGVVGPVLTIPYQLDQFLPVFNLASQRSGDRVSGTINLTGSLSDGNGLKSLDYTTDGGATVVSVPLQGDAKALNRPFSFPLDTRIFPDGPLVLQFHGIDGQGSEVRRAVLLYVDNTVPAITVLTPAANQGVHGKVRFAVQVEKTLGIQSLSARVGDKGARVALSVVPGNPFHTVDLVLPSTGSDTIPVIFEAIDTAGKVGQTTYLARLNGDTDLPTYTLSTELNKAQVKAPFRLVGTLKATDGPSALAWSLNGAKEVVQPAGVAFDFLLPGLVTGLNTLTLTAIDANAKRGKPVTSTFTAVLGPPSVRLDSLVLPDQEVSFRPGLGVSPDKKSKLKGTLTWPNPPKSVTW